MGLCPYESRLLPEIEAHVQELEEEPRESQMRREDGAAMSEKGRDGGWVEDQVCGGITGGGGLQEEGGGRREEGGGRRCAFAFQRRTPRNVTRKNTLNISRLKLSLLYLLQCHSF